MEGAEALFQALPRCWAPPSKDEHSHLLKEAHYGHISHDHDPNLVTVGEGWNIDKKHFSFWLHEFFTVTNPRSLRIMNPLWSGNALGTLRRRCRVLLVERDVWFTLLKLLTSRSDFYRRWIPWIFWSNLNAIIKTFQRNNRSKWKKCVFLCVCI